MECIIFIGIQASGKSTFYKERFLHTHIHINLDKLRTRHREKVFLNACFETKIPFVVDNTNPTRNDRQRYIPLAKQHQYRVIGFYFQSKIEEALQRNTQREARIPEIGIRATHAKLELASYDEGFDELYYVSIADGQFQVKAWQDEI